MPALTRTLPEAYQAGPRKNERFRFPLWFFIFDLATNFSRTQTNCNPGADMDDEPVVPETCANALYGEMAEWPKPPRRLKRPGSGKSPTVPIRETINLGASPATVSNFPRGPINGFPVKTRLNTTQFESTASTMPLPESQKFL